MKHIHAELMALYAQDAMETDKPWERWEYYSSIDQCWVSFEINHPTWNSGTRFRRRPTTININGHKVPEPYRGEMRYGQFYYIPKLDSRDLYNTLNWCKDACDQRVIERGLVHLTKEAAIKHTEALLSFTK